MNHVSCRLTAKNRDQLRNPKLGNRVWTTFTLGQDAGETTSRVCHHGYTLLLPTIFVVHIGQMCLSVRFSFALASELSDLRTGYLVCEFNLILILYRIISRSLLKSGSLVKVYNQQRKKLSLFSAKNTSSLW